MGADIYGELDMTTSIKRESKMTNIGFNGKEWYETVGWYDYGARWYDTAVGRLPSIDRFAEKYAFQAPYAYAANNPIKFIDVNGDSIWISHGSSNLLYENGMIYNSDGSLYTGRGTRTREDGSIKYPGFLGSVTRALGKISESDIGNTVIADLQASEYDVFISQSGINQYLPDDHGSPGINVITNNTYAIDVISAGEPIAKHLPYDHIGDGGFVKWTGENFIELAHELGHAHDGVNGLLTSKRAEIGGGLEEIREIRAVYFANRVRQYFGMALRPSYGAGHRDCSLKCVWLS